MPRICRLIAVLLLSIPALAQQCTFRGTFTTATTGTPFLNNTTQPNCNAFALTWNSTGFSAITIALQGSDNGSSWTTFTGASTVLVGTNPASTLSGAIVIQASASLAQLRVNITSVTGTGGINYQVYGYNGVTPAAKTGGSGGGVTSVTASLPITSSGGTTPNIACPTCVTPTSGIPWTDVTAGTNSAGFLQVHSPTILEPTAISGGGIYGTQLVDGNDLPALTITTPGGPALDYFNISTTTGGGGATITMNPTGSDSNVSMSLLAKGTGLLNLGSTSAHVDNAGNLTVTSCSGCGGLSPTLPSADIFVGNASNVATARAVSQDASVSNTGVWTNTGINGAAVPALTAVLGTNISGQLIAGNPSFSVLTSGTNTIAAMLVGTGASLGVTGTGTNTATQVTTGAAATATTNGQIKYDTTNNNLHAANTGADSILPVTTVTPANGNCANWSVSSGTLKLGDAGSACGSGSGGGGGVVTYSGPTLSILSGTSFCPVGGGGSCSSTETNVDIDSSASATVSKLYVQLSQALGAGNSVTVTWRDNAVSQSVTCTISGASATACNDTTHSFNVATGDLIDYQLVFTGTIVVTPTVTMMSAFGTSNVGVTSVTGTSPITSTGGTTPAIACATCVTSAASLTSGSLMTGAGSQASQTGNATAHTLDAIQTCVAASASGTAYTCSTSPTFTPASGDTVLFKADVASTASATLAVNGASAATIKQQGGGANIGANTLLASQWTVMTFDGTNWQMNGQTGAYQGNGVKSQLSTGTTTTNDCVKFDANGNTVDSGNTCNTGPFQYIPTVTCSPSCVAGTSQVQLATPSTTITFSVIPSTFSQLLILISGASTNNGTVNLQMVVNGDTTTNHYVFQALFATGGSGNFSSFSGGSTSMALGQLPGTQASNLQGVYHVEINGYAVSGFLKTITSYGGWLDTNAHMGNLSGGWLQTSAVTSLQFSLSGGNFAAGTEISLYGIL